MLRPVLSAFALAAALISAPVAAPAAHAQVIEVPAEFNQTLIDRWLVVFPEITRLGHWATSPPSEAEGQAHMERICTGAGFDSFDQCASTIGYAGMLISGFDPRTGTFRDPIANAYANIARIEGNPRIPPDAKEKATAPMRQIIATFPKDIPPDHLHLMTANRDRIFQVLKGAARK